MLKKIFFVCSFALITLSANATLISKDLSSVGDGLITLDSDTNLEWLDLSQTAGRSYNDISSQLGVGGEFAGWSYVDGFSPSMRSLLTQSGFIWPSGAEVLHDFRPGDPNFANAWNTFTSFLGESNQPGTIFGMVLLNHPTTPGSDQINYFHMASFGVVRFENAEWTTNQALPQMASFLVRPSTVPVPASIWLFASGLFGLVTVRRRASKI